MSVRIGLGTLLVFVILGALPLLAGEPGNPEISWETIADRPEKLIPLLGHDAWEVREKAAKCLETLGEKALPALKAVKGDADPEIALRVRILIKRIWEGLPWERKVKEVVPRGLAYLAAAQGKGGGWTNAFGFKLNMDYRKTGEGPHVGVTAIAGLAFLAAGHTVKEGKHAAPLKRAVDFVLGCVDPKSGFITNGAVKPGAVPPPIPGMPDKRTGMYSHAFGGLFLTQVYAVSPSDDVKGRLDAAVGLAVKSQNEEGGWRYLPTSKDADLSITACQLRFLLSAKRAGISVPQATIDKAVAYVKKCQPGPGAFRYQGGVQVSRVSFALTAAGLAVLEKPTPQEVPQLQTGLVYLLANRPTRVQPGLQDFHYFYSHYFAVQVFLREGGKAWGTWWPATSREIIQSQRGDGSWIDEVGPHYATAMGCLILSAPMEKIPLFKRPR
ncbi:MAG: hypothetical protein ACYTHM_02100 [Planctomycetota bacterium]|jgi:hypothetical protein